MCRPAVVPQDRSQTREANPSLLRCRSTPSCRHTWLLRCVAARQNEDTPPWPACAPRSKKRQTSRAKSPRGQAWQRTSQHASRAPTPRAVCPNHHRVLSATQLPRRFARHVRVHAAPHRSARDRENPHRRWRSARRGCAGSADNRPLAHTQPERCSCTSPSTTCAVTTPPCPR